MTRLAFSLEVSIISKISGTRTSCYQKSNWIQDYGNACICNFHKEKPLKRGERAPWISTTPLWAWAVGEAIERKRLGILDRNRAQKIRMSVIDLRKLLAFERSLRLPDELGIESRTVFYGMELLRLGNQMNDPYAPAWTNHPQEVLVYAIIPASTIINTISFDSPGQYQATPWLDLPLPPWFFHRFESRSFSVHEVVWPRSHSADWFSGDEKGARISLLRNFKKWVVSKPVLGITDDIASAAFRLAEILVLPRETFQEAIEEARERAWYLEREAAEATETLVEYLEEEYHFPGLDKFPREDILADVHKLWNRTREMAEMIVLWGFDKVNDDYWKRLQKQIIFHGEKYVEAIEDLEVEVAKCEAGYDYYKSLREKRTVGLALSSRPNFALW
ncbi:hypothetical protein GYMLUDRAFT_37842 [Collybiopsis luxurians FD-317 M1]|nr:hypothetical protein GYMLUDRAFT_37842 [Collybiopsis luxurians FD-317 M1]